MTKNFDPQVEDQELPTELVSDGSVEFARQRFMARMVVARAPSSEPLGRLRCERNY